MSQLVQNIAGMYIPPHDYVDLEYIASGDGAGELGQVTFKKGGVDGTEVARVILEYDSADKLAAVKKV